VLIRLDLSDSAAGVFGLLRIDFTSSNWLRLNVSSALFVSAYAFVRHFS